MLTNTPYPTRFKATYRGDVIGWFDTAIEAQDAITKADDAEQESWLRRYQSKMRAQRKLDSNPAANAEGTY